ncbi:MAG: twin-arginine translocation signal domain-containing protein [Bacteroidia bacterium]
MSEYIPRRGFIKKTALAAAGMAAAPYILPSGRLFAASGNRVANHVVFCLFAGGIRNIESVQKERGNLMPGTLNGGASVDPSIAAGMDPLPAVPGLSLQAQGTMFHEFRYDAGPTGHFNGHSTAITGSYTLQDLSIKEPPKMPTVFEYYRKHSDPTQNAMNAWWISNTLGPYPSLNYSSYPGYGAMYGANYMQPSTLISTDGLNALSNPRVFSSAEGEKVNKLRNLFNSSFNLDAGDNSGSIRNAESNNEQIQAFLRQQLLNAQAGQYNDPWGAGSSMNGDMFNVFFAEKVIQEFNPELLVVNMQGVDVCHSNFTEYCNNLRKADYAVAHLWQTIQNTPGMANDTILIVAPEHGRNLEPNTLLDAYGQPAIDHTSDATSREIFCLVVGPSGKVIQGQNITDVTGESIDIVPTIAHVLGFKDAIPGGLLAGRVLNEAFV